MTINGDYSAPVVVNGFPCANCADVENAKKHIDPAHPDDGPYGIDARESGRAPSVTFGGALSGAQPGAGPAAYSPGAALNLAV